MESPLNPNRPPSFSWNRVLLANVFTFAVVCLLQHGPVVLTINNTAHRHILRHRRRCLTYAASRSLHLHLLLHAARFSAILHTAAPRLSSLRNARVAQGRS